jgi:hypothetical protein
MGGPTESGLPWPRFLWVFISHLFLVVGYLWRFISVPQGTWHFCGEILKLF